MTDKLDPGWVNDRLPTEEDSDEDGGVIWYHSRFGKAKPWSHTGISSEDTWCRVPKEWQEKDWPNNWRELIATPQECLDREKGEEVGEGLIKLRKKQMENDANEPWKKVKDLEQALAKSQQENKELKEAWATLVKYNDQEDKLSDELEVKLAKSEERVKEMEREKVETEESYNWYVRQRDALLPENQILKKLLIKEWGG